MLEFNNNHKKANLSTLDTNNKKTQKVIVGGILLATALFFTGLEYHNRVPITDNIVESPSYSSDITLDSVSIDKDSIDMDLIEKEIQKGIDEIIVELDLKKSDDIMEQYKNCCAVQKYIVENISYDANVMDEKAKYSPSDIAILDLYNAIVNHRGVCTSNSLLFKRVLKELDMNVEVIGLLSTEGGMHASNIVELDGKYYFFDTTLEATIYNANKELSNGKLILCCAGLGANEYCKYYKPQVILPDNPMDPTMKIPDNIALNSIPQGLTDNFDNIILGNDDMLEVGTIVEAFFLPNGKTGEIVAQRKDLISSDGSYLYDVIDEEGKLHTIAGSLFDKINGEPVKNGDAYK